MVLVVAEEGPHYRLLPSVPFCNVVMMMLVGIKTGNDINKERFVLWRVDSFLGVVQGKIHAHFRKELNILRFYGHKKS